MKITPFYFDCNAVWREVRSAADWQEVVYHASRVDGLSISDLHNARKAPPFGMEKPGALPNFGFYPEHVGSLTLGSWAAEHGMNLWRMALMSPRIWATQLRVPNRLSCWEMLKKVVSR